MSDAGVGVEVDANHLIIESITHEITLQVSSLETQRQSVGEFI